MMAGRHDSINRQIPSIVSSKRGCKAALNGSRVTRRQRFIAVSRRHAGRGHDPSQTPSILSPKSGSKTDLNRSRVERARHDPSLIPSSQSPKSGCKAALQVVTVESGWWCVTL